MLPSFLLLFPNLNSEPSPAPGSFENQTFLKLRPNLASLRLSVVCSCKRITETRLFIKERSFLLCGSGGQSARAWSCEDHVLLTEDGRRLSKQPWKRGGMSGASALEQLVLEEVRRPLIPLNYIISSYRPYLQTLLRRGETASTGSCRKCCTSLSIGFFPGASQLASNVASNPLVSLPKKWGSGQLTLILEAVSLS